MVSIYHKAVETTNAPPNTPPFMNRVTITAGGCHVGASPAVIETFLGSCVGIAIYENKERIGGLVHIVLPEGSAKKEEEKPSVYARSGIPYLIAAMEAVGAKRSHLTASIAGGAHIHTQTRGPNLNIGLRNIQAVRAALARESIPLLTEEVGGDFGRLLIFFLTDGKVEIRPSRPWATRTGQETQRAMAPSPPTLEPAAIEEAIHNLRPVSDAAIRALEMAQDPSSSFHQLECLILQDQVLAANVLHLANSAFHSLPRRISTISQALTVLGLNAFRKLVMQAFAHHFFARKLFAYSMEEGALFRHSVACAQLAELLANDCPGVEREEAYMAGLLHDIGKVVLERCAGPRFPHVMDLVLFKHKSFHRAEQEILGVDHSMVGRILGEMWKLPADLIETIALHHQPALAKKAIPLVKVVHLADMLCNMLGVGMGVDAMANRWDPDVLQDLHLNEQAVESLLATIPLLLHQYDS